MCKSNITAKKFAKLFFEIMLYRILFYFVFMLSGYESLSLKVFVKAFVPIIDVSSGFDGAFLIFYLFIPFLNILIKSIDEKQHIKLLFLLGFTYVFFGTVPFFSVKMNYVSWFCVLYLIASYIRLYPKSIFENTRFWGCASLITLTVSCISIIACTYVNKMFGILNSYYFVSDSNTLLALLLGLCSFMFFKNLNIKNNMLINKISSSTFGVLLIHAGSDTMRRWLWRDTLNNLGAYETKWAVWHAVGSVLAVYIICTLIDAVISQLIKKPIFKLWDKYWDNILKRYTVFENKFFEKIIRKTE